MLKKCYPASSKKVPVPIIFDRIFEMIKLVCVTALALFIVLVPRHIHAEVIQNFDVTAYLNDDGTALIEEKILYDFEQSQKHGMFRRIPYIFDVGGFFFVKTSPITVISVTDENNIPYTYQVTRDGSYKTIKIGDADKTISGQHWYVITYRVDRNVQYNQDFDEFFWNVTGNDWQVPIKQSTYRFFLPQQVDPSLMRTICFRGPTGSAQYCEEQQQDDFIHVSDIPAGSGWTVGKGFPKGVIKEPTNLESVLATLYDNWYVIMLMLLPVGTFSVCFVIWRKKGRDPKGRGVIVPQYDIPEGLTMLDIASIMNQQIKNKDISAQIIKLAVDGYIKIQKIEKKEFFGSTTDYQLIKLKEGSKEAMNPVEFMLLDRLFFDAKEVQLSTLKNKFYSDVEDLEDTTQNNLIMNGYYTANPEKATKKYFIFAWGAFYLSFYALSVIVTTLLENHFFVVAIPVLVSIVIILIFGYLMP